MSSLSMDCFRSVLKAFEYPVFSHIAEKTKTRRRLNEMKYMGFILDRIYGIFWILFFFITFQMKVMKHNPHSAGKRPG